MLYIVREIAIQEYLPAVCEVIRLAFATVAEELHLTRQNCRYHPAFLSDSDLADSLCRPGVLCFGAISNDIPVGFAAVWPKSEDAFAMDQAPVAPACDAYELARLCVLPEYRHAGLGARLLQAAFQAAKEHGAQRIEIGIIAENERLRRWYEHNGFTVTAVREYSHLPFTVCEMERELQGAAWARKRGAQTSGLQPIEINETTHRLI